MAIIVEDQFIDIDLTSLHLHSPDVAPGGAAWTELQGDWIISGNRAINTLAANNARALIDAGVADEIILSASCAHNTGSTSVQRDVGLVIRADLADTWYQVGFNEFSGVFRIVEVNASVFTEVASVSVAIAPDTFHTIVATVSGQTITATLDGANEISYSNASLNQASTLHGIRGRDPTTQFEWFLIETADAGQDDLTATGITTGAPVLGSPGIGQTHKLTSAGAVSGIPEISGLTLGQTHLLTAFWSSAGSPVLGSPTLGQTHELVVSSLVAGSAVLGQPSLTPIYQLTVPDLVAGQPILGQPTISQIHELTSAGAVTGQPILEQPTLSSTQTYNLTALHLETGDPVVGIPSLGQTQVLTAESVQSGEAVIELPDLGQTHVLAAELLAAGSVVVGSPTLFIGIIEVPFERTYRLMPAPPTPQFEIREIEIREDRVYKFPPCINGG